MKNNKFTIICVAVVILVLASIFAVYSSKPQPQGSAFDTTSLTNFSASSGATVATSTGAGATAATTTLYSSVNSPDVVLTILTGGSPAGSNALIATITLPFSCPTGTIPNLSPTNTNAAALSGATQVFVASSTSLNAYLLKSGSSALTGATVYAWDIRSDCY